MTKITIPKPPNLLPEHLTYLNDLRESGATNMWGASPFLERRYPSLSKDDAKDILLYWMDSHE